MSSDSIVYVGNAADNCGVGFYTTTDYSGTMYVLSPGSYTDVNLQPFGVSMKQFQMAQSTPSCSATITFTDGSTNIISSVQGQPIGGTTPPTQIDVAQAASSEYFTMPSWVPFLGSSTTSTTTGSTTGTTILGMSMTMWIILIVLIIVIGFSIYYYCTHSKKQVETELETVLPASIVEAVV